MIRHALFPLALLVAAPASARDLGFDDALRIGSEAVKTARAQGRDVAVVVVNREGRVIVAMRMDGVSFMNLDVAQAKAATAAGLSVPSMAIEHAVKAGETPLLSVTGLSAIGGGIPVTQDGKVVAGVGVSGETSEQDQAIAQAAVGE